jgi:hypothetical protein
MPKQAGPIKIVGTIGILCFYRSDDEYYVRRASSLTRKRVKYDPRFHRTMMNARLLGRASKIASVVYKDLPKNFRQYWMYRAFTGEAMQLLKAGKTDDEARETLWHVYASVHHMPVEMPAISRPSKKKAKPTTVSVFTIIGRNRRIVATHSRQLRSNRVHASGFVTAAPALSHSPPALCKSY